MPDLGKMFDENRDKVEKAAEAGVDALEKKTGHTAPGMVDDKVDEIDPSDGDGGPADATSARGATDARDPGVQDDATDRGAPGQR